MSSIVQANNERMKQTLARTTAQLESNRKRLKDVEVKQSKAPAEFDRSYLEEVGKLKQQLHELELDTQELRDTCTVKDATVQSLQQQLTSSQDLVRCVTNRVFTPSVHACYQQGVHTKCTCLLLTVVHRSVSSSIRFPTS